MGMGVEAWLRKKLDERQETSLLRRWGGIQLCPWCLQYVQKSGDWSIAAWDRDPFLDVITCGPCGGTSLWRFEMLMIYIGPLAPPKAKLNPAPYYDIDNARFIPDTGSEK